MDKTVLESLYDMFSINAVNKVTDVDERSAWGDTYDPVRLDRAKTEIRSRILMTPYQKIPDLYEPDIVNHPDHYICGELETIDVIQAWVENFESYCIGNVIKYVSRYKKKNGVEDLKKARWYLDKIINLTENIDQVKES